MRVRFIYILVVRVAVFVTFCCQKVNEKKLVTKPYSLNLPTGRQAHTPPKGGGFFG